MGLINLSLYRLSPVVIFIVPVACEKAHASEQQKSPALSRARLIFGRGGSPEASGEPALSDFF